MKSFKTVDKLDCMKELGNESILNWIENLWGNALQKLKNAFDQAFSQKKSFTVDIDQVAKKYKLGNEDNSFWLFMGGIIGVIFILNVIKEYLNPTKTNTGENVFDKVDEVLKVRGNEPTRCSDEKIKSIAEEYCGYAALFQDVKLINLNKNYWKELYNCKNEYLPMASMYDVDDFSILIRNVNDLDNWSYTKALVEIANRFNNNGKITVDKEILHNLFSGVSHYYGGLMSSESKNTFFTRIKKTLDKPLVDADLYYPIDLYESFIYYWVKIESDTKYTFGLANSLYKKDNSYTKQVFNQIKTSPIKTFNNSIDVAAKTYWHWYTCFYGNGEDTGYLYEFYKKYGVNPKDSYGSYIFIKVADYILNKKGIYNNPNFNKEVLNVLYETVIGLVCSYNSDIVKRRLYKNDRIFDNSIQLILTDDK